MNFVAIDFETANISRSSICSVGLAFVEKGRLIGSEHIYVKPVPNHYDPFNTALHGISDKHTCDQRTFKEQWKELKKHFHNQIVVAHNAAFDFSVLRFTLEHSQLSYPDLEYHCTYRLAQAVLPIPSHRLNDVSTHYKIKLEHHNAESDAKAAAMIAIKLCEQFKVSSLSQL